MLFSEWVEENATREELLKFVLGSEGQRDKLSSMWGEAHDEQQEAEEQEAEDIRRDEEFQMQRDCGSD